MILLNTLNKGKRWAGFLLIALMPFIAEAQVSLSLPDTTVRAGETIDVPVYVSGMDASLGVISGEFEFSFNSNILEITGVNKTGTILETVGNVLYFKGTNRMAFAATDTVAGNGVLVYLKVKGKSEANYFQSSSLSFVSASFNEGSPTAGTSNGFVRIEGVTISPKFGIQVVKGDSLQFSLTQDVTNPVTWTVTDTSRATIDANGLLVTKETGQIQVKGVDANGLADSTQFFSILPENFSDLTVTLPDTTTAQTLVFDLPIMVTDLTGLGVLSAEFDISFNQNFFTVEEVLPGELTTSWGNPVVNIDASQVQIAGAGSDTLAGAGVLYYIRFRTKNTISGNTTVTLNSSAFNEDLSATNENATVTVNLAPVIEVTPGDTALSIGNSLQFNIGNSNGTAPYTWESSDEAIGSIDPNTGLLTGVSRGDITIISRDAENFPSQVVNVRVNDFDAYLDSALLVYPDTASIGIITNDLTSYGLTSFEMEFQYDTTRLDFAGVGLDNTLAGDAGLTIEIRDTSEVIKIAGAGTTALAGGKSLLNLLFTPKEIIANQDSINLYFQSLSFNEPSTSVPTLTTLPGLITVQRIDPPVAPVLATPVDGTTNADTLEAFDWTDVAQADSYRFQLSTDSTFAITTIDSVTATSDLTAAGLDFATTYYWRALASNAGGESPWTDPFSISTRIQEPEVPVILNPADSIAQTDTVIFFGWNTTPRAESYQLQITTAEDFSTIDYDQTGLIDTVSKQENLSYLTRYYWRLRAVNAGGNSAWTTPRTFLTKAKPAPVITLLSPADNAVSVDTAATLTWDGDPAAAEYQVQLSVVSDFSTNIVNQIQMDSSLAVTGLARETAHYWRVRSIGAAADTSAWSAAYTFTTVGTELAAPILLNPTKDAVGVEDSLTFNWSGVFGADGYTFELDDDTSTAVRVLTSSLADTSTTVDSLNYSATYLWRVKANDSVTPRESVWTPWFAFTVKPEPAGTPVLLSPADNSVSVDTATALVWNSNIAAAEYQVQLSNAADFSSTIADQIQVDTTLSVTGLARETAHFWRVRSIGAAADTSAWSVAFTFTTVGTELAAPILLNPSKDALGVEDSVTFNWSGVTGADGYMFELDDDTSTVDRLISSSLADTSTTVDSLNYSATYLWRVKATDSVTPRESVWTPWFAFTVKSAPAVIPGLLSPADIAVGVDTATTLVWSADAANAEYQVQLSGAADFSAIIAEQVQVDTTLSVTGLARETEHFWRVRGIGADADTSDWSVTFSFTTVGAGNQPPVVANPMGEVILDEDFADTTIADMNTVFSDPESGALTYLIESSTGLVSVQLTGSSLILSSVADTSGFGNVIIKATDDIGQEVRDTLTVVVAPVNDLPFVVSIPDTITFNSGEVYNFQMDTSFRDLEDQITDLTFTASVTPSDIFVSFNPSTFVVSLTSPTYTGPGSIDITVTDTDGGVLEVSIPLKVTLPTFSELDGALPDKFTLNQNYPNPFNPSSTISFGVPEVSEVRLDVYNMLGQKVATLVNEKMQAGWHSVQFDASGLSTGTYIYRIQAGNFVQTKKMMLIK